MKQILLTICCVLVSFFCLSQPILWDGKSKSIDIGQKVYILEDPEGNLSINQVSAPAFAQQFALSKQQILNFGFSKSVYWLRFSLENNTQENLWLELAQAFLPITELHFKDQQGRWQSYQAGYKIGLNQKAIKHHYQLFALPGDIHEFYIRFQSHTHPIPIRIWQNQAYETESNKLKIIYGVYIGILFFVILNNLFLFFSLKRFSYLHYSSLVFMHMMISLFVMDGYIVYFFPNVDLMYWYILFPLSNMANTALYGLLFLEVRKYAPNVYKLGLVILFYFISYILWYRFLPLMVVLPLNQINALISLFLALTLGIVVSSKGNKIGYYFSLAYFIYFCFVIVEIIYIQTGSPSYFFELSHVSIALFLEVLLLAYALSRRFEWERMDIERAKFEAQKLLLEKTQENQKLVVNQNTLLEQKVIERTSELREKNEELTQTLDHLKATQNQLIQKEKMASLGEITAGIAHEIQNPLNFVNNFSEVSAELITELQQELAAGDTQGAKLISKDIQQNLEKIHHHGKRADSIVKGMLQHSGTSSGEKQSTSINTLADDYLRLAYNGMRAKENYFHANLVTEFDLSIGKVEVVPQEIGRVLLNLFNNAFYATAQKKTQLNGLYQPEVKVSTKAIGNTIEIRVKDNGIGIPKHIMQKIFQPFFTTKPTGEGTGLGLSLSYDIITKGYGGDIKIYSTVGEYSQFIISLPIKP